ncbi:P-type conjugative transfer protein TrbL [Hydrogenophaga crassostreae]|uniref:P-type conjugative transfer protein TrbL n=2 Tax=Hydrogenophaga crassostreae TaxID=1763535 RepID=A0A167IJW8_9BURK|nr:P-type conjugative transfer protein TrbL [Hydrogenophaga crassostreae]OAD43056.1 P-type conjugative transfer protein TrbL [Hydrogenophaga crassostreae]
MRHFKPIWPLAVVLMLYSTGAAAQLTNQGMLDQVVTEFATRAASWQSVVMNAAMFLFWTLATISLVWTGGTLILRKADIGEFFAEFFRFIMFFGFFLWLLRNGPAIASSIVLSLQRLGEQASGVSSVTPSGIVDIGFMIWKQAISNLSLWNPIDSFVGTALSVAIMLLLAAVAINMLLIMVSAWFLMYAGIFFLGFGGSRWTSDMAINYYKTLLGIAVQLMAMVLLVGIGNDLLTGFYARMNKGTLNFEELGVMLVFCFALLMLVTKIPGLLSGVITGMNISQAGIGGYGAGSVAGAAMGAAGLTAAAAGVAGAAVVSGAQNAVGGASAVKAAFEKAQAGMGGGEGSMPSFGAVSNGAGSSNDTGSTPYAQAAGFSYSPSKSDSEQNQSGPGNAEKDKNMSTSKDGKNTSSNTEKPKPEEAGSNQQRDGTAEGGGGVARAATLTAGTAANLAAGVGSLVKNKAVELAAGFKEGVDNSLAGKVASTIRASSQRVEQEFASNSLEGTYINEEVAAFVNKHRRGPQS